jgi:hypothetical protein
VIHLYFSYLIQCNLFINKIPIDKASHVQCESQFTYTVNSKPRISSVLPPKSSTQLTDMELDECEETTLHDVNIEDEMRRKQHSHS